MFSKLEETFDLVPATVELSKTDVVEVEPRPEPTQEDLRDKADRELARETFRRMISKSEDMLESLMQIAAGTEHPRAFEVAANLVKTVTDVASKLEETASKNLVPQKGKGASTEAPQVQNNNLFVGSSEELMKLIRNNSQP